MKKKKTMKKSKHVVSLTLLLLIAALALNGCTAIFGALGMLSDASKSEATVFSNRQTLALKHGAALRIVLNDGTRLFGKYSGTARIAFLVLHMSRLWAQGEQAVLMFHVIE